VESHVAIADSMATV